MVTLNKLSTRNQHDLYNSRPKFELDWKTEKRKESGYYKLST